jgi:hypothetical protein
LWPKKNSQSLLFLQRGEQLGQKENTTPGFLACDLFCAILKLGEIKAGRQKR